MSSLNSSNIAEPSGRDQLNTEDHEMISDHNEDQVYDNKSDLDFLGTMMQFKRKYHKPGLKYLIKLSKNAMPPKMVKKNVNFSRLY